MNRIRPVVIDKTRPSRVMDLIKAAAAAALASGARGHLVLVAMQRVQPRLPVPPSLSLPVSRSMTRFVCKFS